MEYEELNANQKVKVEVISDIEILASTDYEKAIFDLTHQIDLLSSHADNLDYFIAVASGLLCGALDIMWTGEFSLVKGRSIASDQVDSFVVKISHLLGCKENDVQSCVDLLEKFHIPADGNTPDFGGGLNHHLRDFAHHPTIVGLMFSILTQFTEMSYGTDAGGHFLVVPISDKSLAFIGQDIPEKIFNGTIIWFFHLVSDMAGSSATAGITGGTGIPGPILSLAKEISAIPVFNNFRVGDHTLSSFLSKLFNGTFFVKRDVDGNIIRESVVRLDLRGEMGIGIEIGKQAVPVIANECMVRMFYFVRRFALVIKDKDIQSFDDLKMVDWDNVKPVNNPTLTRMLTIATGVFTSVDVGEAIATGTYWVSVNYIGVGRFAVALGTETLNFLKIRDIKKIKCMYEEIQRNTYNQTDEEIYNKMASGLDLEKFGLTVEQTAILYNIELLKTEHDVEATLPAINRNTIVDLKKEWIEEWKHYITSGFAAFVQNPDAKIQWYQKDELFVKIRENEPTKPWLRLVLLEAMLFEPYYPLSFEKAKKGKEMPSKKYDLLKVPAIGYRKDEGDNFINKFLSDHFELNGYVIRLRKCYNRALRELNEVLKNALKSVGIAAAIALIVTVGAGAFAPSIAVALVGSQFAGLSGVALTNACLAFLGGGAIAAGGLGMAGGTAVIVGGGAILGIGLGAGIGGGVGAIGMLGKKETILQSAKLMVAMREIFLNDEHDIAYSDTIYEQYGNNIIKIQKDLVDLKMKADVAGKEEKKKLQLEIKNIEESVEVMRKAWNSMRKFNSAFEMGMKAEKGQS